MVTHAHELVKKFNHRVMLLNDGKIVGDYPAKKNRAVVQLGGELIGTR